MSLVWEVVLLERWTLHNSVCFVLSACSLDQLRPAEPALC